MRAWIRDGAIQARAHEHRLRRMVVARVEGAQHGVAQARYRQRIAARVDCVGSAGQQRREDAAPQRMHRIGHGPLHLVEHDALQGQRPVLEHVAPAFLQEVQVVQRRLEAGVQVDVEQVEEVALIGTGEQVGGAIGLGTGVHVGRERAPQHRKERRAHREAPRPAQGQVFEDVGTAVAGIGQARKTRQEGVFPGVGGHVDMARARVRIAVLFDGGPQRGHGMAAGLFKAVGRNVVRHGRHAARILS
jgi:hypothetical protein